MGRQMRKWKKKLCQAAVFLLLPLALALAVQYFHTNLSLNYCKNFISYGEGFAGIQESDSSTSIFSTDAQGNLTGHVQVWNTDYLSLNIKSFDSLFLGDDGALYVVCSLHDGSSDREKVIYQVDFQWEILREVWRISLDETKESFLTGELPSTWDGVLYYTVYQKEGNLLVTYSMAPGEAPETVSTVPCMDSSPERCLYSPSYGLICLYRDQGVYLDQTRLYPQEESQQRLFNSLNLQGNTLSFLDLYEEQILHLSLETGQTVQTQATSQVDLSRLQSIVVSQDGSMTAALEQDNQLQGAYITSSGTLRPFSEIAGAFCWLKFGFVFLVVLAGELGLWALIWLLFIRRRRKGQQKRRFIGVASKISMLTAGVALIGVAAIVAACYGNIAQNAQDRLHLNSVTSSGTVAGYLSGRFTTVETNQEGQIQLTQETLQVLRNWEEQQEELYLQDTAHATNHSLENHYTYEIFVLENGQLYCLYSRDVGDRIPAEYAVSYRTMELCQKALRTQSVQVFEDRRSVGVRSYAVSPVLVSDDQGREVWLAVAAVTDGYDQNIEVINTLPWILLAAAVSCLVLIVLENMLVRLFTRRLKRLNRGLAEGKVQELSGGDEIAVTSQTMNAMLKNIQVYLEDIQECNDRYKMLIPNDIFTLMGKSSFTQAQPGEQVSFKTLLLVLAFGAVSSAQVNTLIASAMEAVRAHHGMILHYNQRRMSFCFQNPMDAVKTFERMMENLALCRNATALFCSGDLQIGVVGSETVKRTLVLSPCFEVIEQMQEFSAGSGALGFVTQQEKELFENNLKGFQLRLAGKTQQGTAFYELIEKGEDPDDPKLKNREGFEQALTLYFQGDYRSALARLEEICRKDPEDFLAARYRVDCEKRLGGDAD